MKLLFELGRHVKERRLVMGLSQGGVAKLTGLSRVTINQLESGKLVNSAWAMHSLLRNFWIRLGLNPHEPDEAEIARKCHRVVHQSKRGEDLSMPEKLLKQCSEPMRQKACVVR